MVEKKVDETVDETVDERAEGSVEYLVALMADRTVAQMADC